MMAPESTGPLAPGPDIRIRWAAAEMSSKRATAAVLLSPEYLGELRVLQISSQGGVRVPAVDRVVLVDADGGRCSIAELDAVYADMQPGETLRVAINRHLSAVERFTAGVALASDELSADDRTKIGKMLPSA